ncbi:NAD(P)-binding protein [Penicillium argentinense]|uniref:NAD(P)-binding protein n=1 Tax=Penicillium argentinense TaxID=1131581 RepID=A0A9W9EXZ0_9EURO|nr:NAD(P)-binding protein [Penicillium argentinense]KAJ5090063.1 NAD(P)-binding protein [Penicillium argentinense]
MLNIMAISKPKLTGDGHELQFATNNLSHFLFFNMLKLALLAGSSPDIHFRVVMVSASAHLLTGLNISDNYNIQKGGYHPWSAYAQLKLENIYMTNEIERRYGRQGVHASSLHPGIVGSLSQEELADMLRNGMMIKTRKSMEQGAATTVWAAIFQDLERRGGLYLNDCAEAEMSEQDGNLVSGKAVPHTYNSQDESRL